MQRTLTDQEQLRAVKRSAWRTLTRRSFFRTAAGTGAGLALGSNMGTARADGRDDDQGCSACQAVPRAIPHFINPPGIHVFLPGPVDTDLTSSPDTGHDPSIITDFQGVIGEIDVTVSGIGTDLHTGKQATYNFQSDMRFMKGKFIGLDNEQHHGEIGFI